MADELDKLPDPGETKHFAVDLDGTLAEYVPNPDPDTPFDPLKIGRPVPRMVQRVKGWLKKGEQVTIFTARVAPAGDQDVEEIRQSIKDWCKEHLGQVLPVTAIKERTFTDFYDDRAKAVERNTGEVQGED